MCGFKYLLNFPSAHFLVVFKTTAAVMQAPLTFWILWLSLPNFAATLQTKGRNAGTGPGSCDQGVLERGEAPRFETLGPGQSPVLFALPVLVVFCTGSDTRARSSCQFVRKEDEKPVNISPAARRSCRGSCMRRKRRDHAHS